MTYNKPYQSVDPDASTPADAPDPSETGVWRCERCGGHFWKGSHWDDVRERLPDSTGVGSGECDGVR